VNIPLPYVSQEANKLYYNTKIIQSSNKTKTIWKVVNQLTSKNKVQNDILTVKKNNCVTDDQFKISQLFNKYFSTTADKINTTKNNKPLTVSMNYLSHAFNTSFPRKLINNITRTEIEKIIKNLKPSNSHGYDEISTKVLKCSSNVVSSPLTYIFNLVISTGTFPTRMKYSIVKPLFKKGDKRNISNYRPISLLISFSKILEKIIYTRL
jgi:hypothetical protein